MTPSTPAPAITYCRNARNAPRRKQRWLSVSGCCSNAWHFTTSPPNANGCSHHLRTPHVPRMQMRKDLLWSGNRLSPF
jgi:hypothetical protein